MPMAADLSLASLMFDVSVKKWKPNENSKMKGERKEKEREQIQNSKNNATNIWNFKSCSGILLCTNNAISSCSKGCSVYCDASL